MGLDSRELWKWIRVMYPVWLARHQLALRKLATRPGGWVWCSNAVMELARGVRAQLEGLLSGLAATDLTPMSLGLSHSLSRYKLKFSPDKVGVQPRPHSPSLLLLCPRPGVGLWYYWPLPEWTGRRWVPGRPATEEPKPCGDPGDPGGVVGQ